MTHLEGGPASTSYLTLSPAAHAILRAALGLRDGNPPHPTLDLHSRIHYAPAPAEVPTCEALRACGYLARAARLADTPAAVRACYIVTQAGHAALLAAERI